uniref:Uncharacterized protein n=1 Tax=Glossina brevipalpis TaxID=37001 RepID=A0A1A9W8V8_9MUSC
MDSIELKCKKPPFRLYRPNVIDNGYYEEYPWCPRSSLYFIGAVGENSGDQFASVLCYSVTSLSVKVLYYEYLPLSKPEVWPKAPDIKSYIGAELVNAVPKDPHLIVSTHFTDAEFRRWFTFSNFKYASVLPQIVSDTLRENLNSLFNIMWWSNLLMGNWNKYRENLLKYVHSSEGVKILSGTYGEVKVPINKIGSSNQFEMSVLKDDSGRTIPQYIWNDVQPIRKGEKHLVIFGFNSPFYEYFPKSDVVLCKSMCEEIEWLSDVQESFGYLDIGFMFCCLHEDVVKLQLLEGLGKEIYSPLDSMQSNKCLSSHTGPDQNGQIEEGDRDESEENSYRSSHQKNYTYRYYPEDVPPQNWYESYANSGEENHNPSEQNELREALYQKSHLPKNYSHEQDKRDSDLDESNENSREHNPNGTSWNKSAERSNEESDLRGNNSHGQDQHDENWGKSYENVHEQEQNLSEQNELGRASHQENDLPKSNSHERDQHSNGLDESYENSRERNNEGNDWNKSTERSNQESDLRENDSSGQDKYDENRVNSYENSQNSYQNSSERNELEEAVHQGGHPSENNWHERDQHGTDLDESYENSREQNPNGSEWNKSSEHSYQDSWEQDDADENWDESDKNSKEQNENSIERDELDEGVHQGSHLSENGRDQHGSDLDESAKGSHQWHRHGKCHGKSQHSHHKHRPNQYDRRWDESDEDSQEENQNDKQWHESCECPCERSHRGKPYDKSHRESHQPGRSAHRRHQHDANRDESYKNSGKSSCLHSHSHGRNWDDSYEDSIQERNQYANRWDEPVESFHQKGQHGKSCDESSEDSRERNEHAPLNELAEKWRNRDHQSKSRHELILETLSLSRDWLRRNKDRGETYDEE